MGEIVQISAVRTDTDGLGELAELWKALHRHHREVAASRDLVQDSGVSGDRRLAFYRRLLDGGAVYLTARDGDGHLAGYAMVAFNPGADDTFETDRGLDTLKIAVMSGNARAQAFYEGNGYASGEHVLDRRL